MDVTSSSQIQKLQDKIKQSGLPPELSDKVAGMIDRLKLIEKETSFTTEYDNATRYIDWVCSLPWDKESQDIFDLSHAKQILDKNHYGLTDVKDRILEYLSVMMLKKNRNVNATFMHAPVISLVGLVGTGKTTIGYSIAEALGRKIERIPFGGMGAATMLRGLGRASSTSEPGSIIKSLRHADTRNPVILLDEIDRISEGSRGDIMGVLLELLDPEQNKTFVDYFIDYPFDLSNVLFITTSNNTKDISVAVLDRLEVIQMPSYTDPEKREIGKSFMLPKILQESGLSQKDLIIDEELWESIIRPLGYDPGIRTLQRTIEGIVRKTARMIIEGKVPSGQTLTINHENAKEFLPQW